MMRQHRLSLLHLALLAPHFLFAVGLAAAAPPSSVPVDDSAVGGRTLLSQLACTACHAPSDAQAQWLSPKLAPRLDGLASRASADWIRGYLTSPQVVMPGVSMPDVLHGLPPADRAEAADALTHFLLSKRSPAFKKVQPDRAAVARGQVLYHRVGCVACHAPQDGLPTTAPAAMPATMANATNVSPLPKMSEKWSFDGLRRFLVDPLASRPSGRMPSLRLTDAEAADIAHYLLRDTHLPAAVELASYRGRIRSLEDIDSAELSRTEPIDQFAVTPTMRDRGSPLRLTSWLRIEAAGDFTFFLSASSAARLSVDGKWILGEETWERTKVEEKVTIKLNAGLHELRADYVHRKQNPPMMKVEWQGPGIAREAIPASRLSLERTPPPPVTPFVVDAAKATAGAAIYAKMNCAACHESKPSVAPPPAIVAVNDTRGCLADAPAAQVPDYHLNPQQKASLRDAIRFLKAPKLASPSPAARVTQTLANLNCAACHARDGVGGVTPAKDRYFTSNGEDLGDEGRVPPKLDGVGNKLKLAWLEQVLVNGASVRPYLDTRMPQFGKENVGGLAELFVSADRKPETLAPVADDPAAQKEAGRLMVGTDGLSCIACHRFNRQPAQTMQLMDLTTATQRLNEDWFRQFLLDPNRFHPATRMPAFWPEGKSPLTKVLGGDTTRQHAAIWTYLADGPQAKFPVGLSRQNLELIVGGEAVVYRGKLWEAGYRAVAVGYPGQLNSAFDAEEMRLALLWRGRFLNAGPHWQVQGMGQIRPQGTDVVVLPHGSGLAVLADAKSPWPAEPGKALGMRFRGYQIDAQQQPTLLYSFRDVPVEDFLTPLNSNGRAGLSRKVTFTAPAPAGLYLRLAVGKLKPMDGNAWRLNDEITLVIKGNIKPLVRGTGDQQELLVPTNPAEKSQQLEVEYAW